MPSSACTTNRMDLLTWIHDDLQSHHPSSVLLIHGGTLPQLYTAPRGTGVLARRRRVTGGDVRPSALSNLVLRGLIPMSTGCTTRYLLSIPSFAAAYSVHFLVWQSELPLSRPAEEISLMC